jgi:hypothetical protein
LSQLYHRLSFIPLRTQKYKICTTSQQKRKALAFAGESHRTINSLLFGIKTSFINILVTKTQDVKTVPVSKYVTDTQNSFLLFDFLHIINILCRLPRSKIIIVTSVGRNQQKPVSDIGAKNKPQQKKIYCILCFTLTLVSCMPQRFSLGDMHAQKLICMQLTDPPNK